MSAHIVRRLIYMVIVLLIMSAVIFFLMHMVSGDPVLMMLGKEADAETVQKLREQLGLNRPVAIQYLDWLWHVIRGDFGESYTMPMSTIDLILQRLPVTLELTFNAMLLSVVLSVPLGIISAIKFNSKLDLTLQVYATAGISMPNFWFGILLIFLVSFKTEIVATLWMDAVF